jgi:hypothetical protein
MMMMMMMIHIQRLCDSRQNYVIILDAISGRSKGTESSEEAAAAVRDLFQGYPAVRNLLICSSRDEAALSSRQPTYLTFS